MIDWLREQIGYHVSNGGGFKLIIVSIVTVLGAAWLGVRWVVRRLGFRSAHRFMVEAEARNKAIQDRNAVPPFELPEPVDSGLSALIVALFGIMVGIVATALIWATLVRTVPALEQWPYDWAAIAVPLAIAVAFYARRRR